MFPVDLWEVAKLCLAVMMVCFTLSAVAAAVAFMVDILRAYKKDKE